MNGVEGYITIEVSQRGDRTIAVLRTLESSNREAPENREEEEFILGHNPRISLYPSSTPLTIPLSYDLVSPLKKPSLRPSSWAHFFTKFIVLGLLGLGSLTSTVKDLLNQDPTKWLYKNFIAILALQIEVSGGILVIFIFQGSFGHFLGFSGILIIF